MAQKRFLWPFIGKVRVVGKQIQSGEHVQAPSDDNPSSCMNLLALAALLSLSPLNIAFAISQFINERAVVYFVGKS